VGSYPVLDTTSITTSISPTSQKIKRKTKHTLRPESQQTEPPPNFLNSPPRLTKDRLKYQLKLAKPAITQAIMILPCPPVLRPISRPAAIRMETIPNKRSSNHFMRSGKLRKRKKRLKKYLMVSRTTPFKKAKISMGFKSAKS
jgi:hypothetical protein